MQLIIAEKPKVGREIALALGVKGKALKTHIEDTTKKIIITWAIGHLVTLKEPNEINEDWTYWSWDSLPMDPETFPLKPVTSTKVQWTAIKTLLKRPDVKEIVCATDAGREGELIFHYIYKLSGCKKPVKRLWTSSMTTSALKEAYEKIKPIEHYQGLLDAAISRSESDWLIGLNGTRAITLHSRNHTDTTYAGVWNVGRVITPTLAIIVNRERAIANFEQRDYWTCIPIQLITRF
ncbi:MAG: DNA topoisomerase [Holophagaceae bacterium]|nr:DNA topoisomerase [Holophagaceae bacterium]